MSHVSASTQSCPLSLLDQRMVSRKPSHSGTNIFMLHLLIVALCNTVVSLSLPRYGAYLALEHLPSREHTELWYGESVVCVRPQGLQQCGTRL